MHQYKWLIPGSTHLPYLLAVIEAAAATSNVDVGKLLCDGLQYVLQRFIRQKRRLRLDIAACLRQQQLCRTNKYQYIYLFDVVNSC
jgi:hypothetical protein